jgi:hypothetical protein
LKSIDSTIYCAHPPKRANNHIALFGNMHSFFSTTETIFKSLSTDSIKWISPLNIAATCSYPQPSLPQPSLFQTPSRVLSTRLPTGCASDATVFPLHLSGTTDDAPRAKNSTAVPLKFFYFYNTLKLKKLRVPGHQRNPEFFGFRGGKGIGIGNGVIHF